MATRIYVVEDHRNTADLLAEALSGSGYTVVTAANGLEALQRMRRQTPDMVVLDVDMPIMDGFTLARRMRQDPRLSDIPVLFLTGFSDFPSKLAGYEAGADDYVVKPFELAEIEARVSAILRRRRPADPAHRDVVSSAGCVLDLAATSLQVDGRQVALTPIESDLLRYLMLAGGAPCSAQTLLAEALDYPDAGSGSSLVRWHISNIRHKIEADPTHPTHLCTVSARGYCFR